MTLALFPNVGSKTRSLTLNCQGIIGRLGDLGAIDKKYDCAASTAGKGALNTIVVDTADTGKQ